MITYYILLYLVLVPILVNYLISFNCKYSSVVILYFRVGSTPKYASIRVVHYTPFQIRAHRAATDKTGFAT